MFIFGLLESISDEWKTIGYDQNLTPFPNMDSEIGCVFFSREVRESLKGLKYWFLLRPNKAFTNSHKSPCEGAKNCQSRWFCGANTSLQNVISHYALASNYKHFLKNYFLRKTRFPKKKSIFPKWGDIEKRKFSYLIGRKKESQIVRFVG